MTRVSRADALQVFKDHGIFGFENEHVDVLRVRSGLKDYHHAIPKHLQKFDVTSRAIREDAARRQYRVHDVHRGVATLIVDADGKLLKVILPRPKFSGTYDLQDVTRRALAMRDHRGHTPYNRSSEDSPNGILMIGANNGGTNPHHRGPAEAVYAPPKAPHDLEERQIQDEFEMLSLGPLVKHMHEATCRVPAAKENHSRLHHLYSVVPKFDHHLLVQCVGLSKNYSSGFHIDKKSNMVAFENVMWYVSEDYDGQRYFASMYTDLDGNPVCVMCDVHDEFQVSIRGAVPHCTTFAEHAGSVLGFASIAMPHYWVNNAAVQAKQKVYLLRTLAYLQNGALPAERPEFADLDPTGDAAGPSKRPPATPGSTTCAESSAGEAGPSEPPATPQRAAKRQKGSSVQSRRADEYIAMVHALLTNDAEHFTLTALKERDPVQFTKSVVPREGQRPSRVISDATGDLIKSNYAKDVSVKDPTGSPTARILELTALGIARAEELA